MQILQIQVSSALEAAAVDSCSPFEPCDIPVRAFSQACSASSCCSSTLSFKSASCLALSALESSGRVDSPEPEDSASTIDVSLIASQSACLSTPHDFAHVPFALAGQRVARPTGYTTLYPRERGAKCLVPSAKLSPRDRGEFKDKQVVTGIC